jgi:hypothetical protein
MTLRTINNVRVSTHFDYPPIPLRNVDWSAIDDSTYGGDPSDPIGRGPTEADAIADLLEEIELREEARAAAE